MTNLPINNDIGWMINFLILNLE